MFQQHIFPFSEKWVPCSHLGNIALYEDLLVGKRWYSLTSTFFFRPEFVRFWIKKNWKILSYRLWLLNKNMALKMSIQSFDNILISAKKCIFTNFRPKLNAALCVFLNESNYVCFDLRRAPINKTTKLRKQKRKKMNEWKPTKKKTTRG